jgi:hypothetical protein
VGYLFHRGIMDAVLPVKILRFLLTLSVFTFYPNFLQFLIFPITCYVSPFLRDNLGAAMVVSGGHLDVNAYVGYNSTECRPFSVPAIGPTVAALLLAASFVVFAAVVSYMSFEINPLSRNPTAMCNGRVETLWLVFKTSAVVLVYGEVSLCMYACVYACMYVCTMMNLCMHIDVSGHVKKLSAHYQCMRINVDETHEQNDYIYIDGADL